MAETRGKERRRRSERGKTLLPGVLAGGLVDGGEKAPTLVVAVTGSDQLCLALLASVSGATQPHALPPFPSWTFNATLQSSLLPIQYPRYEIVQID